ncbi:MAG: DNA-3-methyladenine glycosylase 2 family protein [Planctomycetaceae bacterium]|nr:DNA-3-methyladenine glycosylase 2 family protein [Planctomycetaceae bacterium]
MPVDEHTQRNRSLRRKLSQGEKHLSSACETLSDWIAICGRCQLPVAWDRSVYESLVRAVAHQQLHGRAAECILRRLCDAFPRTDFPSPKQLAAAEPDTLRSLGFSQSKVTAIQGIAVAVQKQTIPNRETAEQLSDEEIISQLITLKGVGRWTAEMLLIFTLGRLDVMPVDDFGVRSGLQSLYDLTAFPGKSAFRELTDAWQPYRSVGAWYLWRKADSLKER